MNDPLLDRLIRLTEKTHGRVILGITGAPGAGKTTLASELVSGLAKQGFSAANIPMDGFHLADQSLRRLGRIERKGAIDTFDGAGYVTLLKRIHNGEPDVIYAPSFERTLEQPVAGSIPVMPDTQIVITEGNYLASPDSPWNQIPALLNELWYCQIDAPIRQERLIRRHVAFGKSLSEAKQWVLTVDEANARQIESWSSRADLII